MSVFDTYQVIDTQRNGWYDDGSEAGAIRVRPVRGDLARVPFDPLQYFAELIGSATATYQTTAVFSNPDGSATGVNVTVPAGLTQGVRIWMPFYGRAFGVRWRRDQGAMPAISVAVDGVTVAVPTGQIPHLVAEGITTQITDAEACMVTHDHLPAGPHVAEIVLVSEAAQARTLTLYGFLLDRRAGYQDLPRLVHALTTIAVPTAATEITTNRGSALAWRGLRKVIYTNVSAAAATVTVRQAAMVVWQKTLQAGETTELEFGDVLSATSNITHFASVASAINATIIGGY